MKQKLHVTGKYKLHGYIEFVPVITGFVTPIFKLETDRLTNLNEYFLESINVNTIQEFIKLPDLCKVEFSHDIVPDIITEPGASCIYAFKLNGNLWYGDSEYFISFFSRVEIRKSCSKSSLIIINKFIRRFNTSLSLEFIEDYEPVFNFNQDRNTNSLGAIETKLLQIWKDVLGLENIAIHDDFFEIGGHSLLAMRLVSKIKRELEVEISVNEVFQFSTISKQKELIESRVNESVLETI